MISKWRFMSDIINALEKNEKTKLINSDQYV